MSSYLHKNSSTCTLKLEEREKVQREKKEQKHTQGTAQENYCSKPLTGEKERATILSFFYKQKFMS